MRWSLFLDDIRHPKTRSPYGGWVVARSFDEAIVAIVTDEEEAGSAVQPEEFGFGSEIEEPMEPTPDMTGSTPVKVAGPSAPGEEGEEGELPEPPRPS